MGARLFSLESHDDPAGGLKVLERVNLPFEVRRVYFIHSVPVGIQRGGHAHKDLEQLMIAVSGSVTVRVRDNVQDLSFRLDSPSFGLHLDTGLWREMEDFSENCVLLVLASKEYDEKDYIRAYPDYVNWIAND